MAGFVIKRLPTIKDEIEAGFREVFGLGVDLSAESPFGQLIGIFAERETLIWELAEDVYDSAWPGTAEGISLDNVGAMVGIPRKEETFSTVNVIIFGTAGTVIPAGKKVSVLGNPQAVFITKANVTIAAAIAEVQQLNFSFGPPASGTFTLTFSGQSTIPLPFNATALDVQAALRAFTNISDDLTVTGNTSTFFTITFAGSMAGINQPLIGVSDTLRTAANAVLFVYTFQVTQGLPAQVPAAMVAQNPGAILAPPGSLTVIDTPVTGWTSVTNPFSAVIGNTLETDAEYRLRRSQVLQRSGSGTAEAIRSDVRNINGVEHVQVFENVGFGVDDNGLPPKSFRVLVKGGPDQVIADTIWLDKPAGIETNGTTTVVIVDSMGYSHDIKFSRPAAVRIYLKAILTIDSALYPADGADRVKAALTTKGSQLGVGDDVICVPYLVAALESIPGIKSVTLTASTNGTTYSGLIVISVFQIATFSTLDVEVIAT